MQTVLHCKQVVHGFPGQNFLSLIRWRYKSFELGACCTSYALKPGMDRQYSIKSISTAVLHASFSIPVAHLPALHGCPQQKCFLLIINPGIRERPPCDPASAEYTLGG